MKTIIIAAVALVTFSSQAIAAVGHKHMAHSITTTALICPVSGTKIASAKAAYNSETYKGKTYYFCCPSCKPLFDKNPAKILADSAKGKYEKM